MLQKLREVVTLIETAESIYNSTATWRVKYDAIFGLEIRQKIREAGYRFEWCDPDMGYEDDVRAYYRALIEFRESLGNLLEETDAAAGVPEGLRGEPLPEGVGGA